MKNGKLQVGIIGSGDIAELAHIPGYKALDNVEIVAVCDIREERVKEIATKFDIPKTFTSYEEMLKMEEIDLVSVCTPNNMHKPPTVAALKAGKHVLCEKPMALNYQEGLEMIEAAKSAGKRLMVGFNNRYRPEAQAIKRYAEAGRLGEMYYARSQALRRRGIPSWGNFIEKKIAGGGPLIDIGVHILDLTLYIMGHSEPTAVSGITYTKFGNRRGVLGLLGQWDVDRFSVEDFAIGLVRFKNGATLLLESSFCANIKEDVFNFTIFGTEGGCQLNPPMIFGEECGSLVNIEPAHLVGYLRGKEKTHSKEIRLFVEAILNDTPTPIPAEEALIVTQILDGIYRSAEKGREIALEEALV
jgi:predicted dehydrogenase